MELAFFFRFDSMRNFSKLDFLHKLDAFFGHAEHGEPLTGFNIKISNVEHTQQAEVV